MLITESQMYGRNRGYYDNDPTSIIYDMVVLPESSNQYYPIMVPIVEDSNLGSYRINLHDIIEFSEANNIEDLGYAVNVICEESQIPANLVTFVVNEEEVIAKPDFSELANQMYQMAVPMALQEVSDNNAYYKMTCVAFNYLLESGDDYLLDCLGNMNFVPILEYWNAKEVNDEVNKIKQKGTRHPNTNDTRDNVQLVLEKLKTEHDRLVKQHSDYDLGSEYNAGNARTGFVVNANTVKNIRDMLQNGMSVKDVIDQYVSSGKGNKHYSGILSMAAKNATIENARKEYNRGLSGDKDVNIERLKGMTGGTDSHVYNIMKGWGAENFCSNKSLEDLKNSISKQMSDLEKPGMFGKAGDTTTINKYKTEIDKALAEPDKKKRDAIIRGIETDIEDYEDENSLGNNARKTLDSIKSMVGAIKSSNIDKADTQNDFSDIMGQALGKTGTGFVDSKTGVVKFEGGTASEGSKEEEVSEAEKTAKEVLNTPDSNSPGIRQKISNTIASLNKLIRRLRQKVLGANPDKAGFFRKAIDKLLWLVDKLTQKLSGTKEDFDPHGNYKND